MKLNGAACAHTCWVRTSRTFTQVNTLAFYRLYSLRTFAIYLHLHTYIRFCLHKNFMFTIRMARASEIVRTLEQFSPTLFITLHFQATLHASSYVVGSSHEVELREEKKKCFRFHYVTCAHSHYYYSIARCDGTLFGHLFTVVVFSLFHLFRPDDICQKKKKNVSATVALLNKHIWSTTFPKIISLKEFGNRLNVEHNFETNKIFGKLKRHMSFKLIHREKSDFRQKLPVRHIICIFFFFPPSS